MRDESQFVIFLPEMVHQQRKPDNEGCRSNNDSQGDQGQILFAGKTLTVSVNYLFSERGRLRNKESCNESRPAVCFGPGQGKVKQSQRSDGGLHAVGQSPRAAVPREPRAQMAEELIKQGETVRNVLYFR